MVVIDRFHCNSLGPERCDSDLKCVISDHILQIKLISNVCDITLRWMPWNTSDYKSRFVLVMAWCHQTTSHYLSHCWLSQYATMSQMKWLKTYKYNGVNGRHRFDSISTHSRLVLRLFFDISPWKLNFINSHNSTLTARTCTYVTIIVFYSYIISWNIWQSSGRRLIYSKTPFPWTIYRTWKCQHKRSRSQAFPS